MTNSKKQKDNSQDYLSLDNEQGSLPTDQINKANRKIVDIDSVERFVVDEKKGLTNEQVALRYNQGLVNVSGKKKGKNNWQIVFSNVFTFFNLIYTIIAVALCIYKQYGQLTFLFVVVANTLIAIVQEIRSKKALDKLTILSMPSIVTIRNGKPVKVNIDSIVLDDVVNFTSGKQVCADCVILSGTVEVNESILTGESEAVVRQKGDVLHAGSFIVANNCVAKVDKVGKFNYIDTLTSKAKKYKKPQSQLLRAFNLILYFVAVIIIPLGYFMWQVNSNAANGDFITTLQKTTGPLIAIIPAGPFLLTSLTLAVSVIRLAKNKTMVQELYCIEMLARVDTLCLDKTGTITDGTMRVVENIDLRPSGENKRAIKDIVGSMQAILNDNNATAKALKSYFGIPKVEIMKPSAVVPFSSARKFSAITFENEGTYFLGAAEFILSNPNPKVDELVKKYSMEGYRVMLLAYSSSNIFTSGKSASQLPLVRRAIAVIVIEDHIRDDAKETLNWFNDNGVNVKIISGDNPLTVSNIARKVGVKDINAISLDGKTDDEVASYALEYNVFGRVSPDQKAVLVKTLKQNGKTVAMTGDGVNDILALRESHCSIAMASGSDAARNVSHLVLLDDNFASLPKVVAEGRRVVNNIQKASSMFFMKTVYTICLMLIIIIMNFGYGIAYTYPYSPTQILGLETFVVGIPTMLLALQPNTDIIKGKFLSNVFKRSLPASLTFFVSTVAIYVFQYVTKVPQNMLSLVTILAITYTFCGLYALYMACKPLKWWKVMMIMLVCASIIGLVTFFTNIPVDGAYVYAKLTREETLLLLTVTFAAAPFYLFIYKLFNGFKMLEKKQQ